MKNLKVKLKAVISFVAITLFMSLYIGEYAYPLPDDTNQLPWYLRKDKQMDAAIPQGQANRLEIERKNAVETELETQALPREEVTPDLKGPRGGVEVKVAVESGEKIEPVFMPGDADGNGKVDGIDLAILADSYGLKSDDAGYRKEADFNSDGKIGIADLMVLANNWGRIYDIKRAPEDIEPRMPGDADGNGKVDRIDLAILADSYGLKSDDAGYRKEADFNSDGKIGIADLMVLANNWGMYFKPSTGKGKTTANSPYNTTIILYNIKPGDSDLLAKIEEAFKKIQDTLERFSPILNKANKPSNTGKNTLLFNNEFEGNVLLPEEQNQGNFHKEIGGLISEYNSNVNTLTALFEKRSFDNLVEALAEKEQKTRVEEDILALCMAIVEESTYLNKKTWEGEYKVVIREALEGILEGVDFSVITDALEKLVKKQRELYESYLDETDTFYQKLSELLGVDVEKDALPRPFTALASIGDMRAKRKILVDIKLERLRGKNKELLTDKSSREIRELDRALQTARKKYMKALKVVFQDFISILTRAIEDKKAVSVKSDTEHVEALFILDRANNSEKNR